ncbi:MAG: chromate transporter [Mogibacterium sp.]|nr:chromate transporter [Mogibacterium sp.]
MDKRRSLPLLVDLYLTFARVGVMMFGGGYAMLPILQREIVEKKGWSTEDQLADYYAVGQCTPGVIAVNTATFVGSYNAGIAGGVFATLGVVSGPIIIITVIAAFLSGYMDLPVIAHAFNGVRACVTALILSSVIKLFKGAVKDWPTRIIYLIVLGLAASGTFLATPANLAAVWDVITSPVFLVLISGVLGLVIRSAKGGLKK